MERQGDGWVWGGEPGARFDLKSLKETNKNIADTLGESLDSFFKRVLSANGVLVLVGCGYRDKPGGVWDTQMQGIADELQVTVVAPSGAYCYDAKNDQWICQGRWISFKPTPKK